MSLLEQSVAAAIGSGLPINEPVGNLVIDIGGGTSETTLISLGGTVALEAVRIGSFDFDAAIQAFIRREFGIAVGERTAEQIKIALGTADPSSEGLAAEIRGRELTTGLPRTVDLTSTDVHEAIAEPLSAILDSVLDCIALAPPDLAHDLIVRGIHLVGGGSLLRDLDVRIGREADVPVHRVSTPLETVALGAGRCIENYEELRSMFIGARSNWGSTSRPSRLGRRR